MPQNRSNRSSGLDGNTSLNPKQKDTKQIGKKQVSPAKRWCFTFNNYTEMELSEIISKFSSIVPVESTYWIIGKEIGEQGTHHLQGYIECKKKFRPTKLKLPNKIHWERCKGERSDNIDYCTKDKNYIKSDNVYVEKQLKILERTELYKWQTEILDIVTQEPHDRKIYWYWEAKGGIGKTTFAKYLSAYHGAVPVEGCKNDILYCCATFPSDTYIFDFERSMEDYISWGAIEKIKNGYYMCAKYESKPIVRNPPHVIIFANFPPDLDKLSKDRWVVNKIAPPALR